jgi:hypothetical protein
MFEPGSSAWWGAVKQFRPDLLPAVNPWERITTPAAVERLLAATGIAGADVVAEDGRQALRSPDDWWTVVLGSGYRWTVDRMDDQTIARVRAANLAPLRQDGVTAIETNVVYAVATKPGERAT